MPFHPKFSKNDRLRKKKEKYMNYNASIEKKSVIISHKVITHTNLHGNPDK